MWTSRSAIEAYRECPMYRYNCYHRDGTGYTPKTLSIPLVTGSAVHRGIEHLLNRLRIGQEPDVNSAVTLAVNEYASEVDQAGFRFGGKGVQTDRQAAFTYAEQKALCEALVRAWALRELPQIQERYEVVGVEREVTPIEIASGIFLQAKVDGEFREKISGDYYNYSVKTCKQFTERIEATYRTDLQGITETWAVEREAELLDLNIDGTIKHFEKLEGLGTSVQANLVKVMEYLGKQKRRKTVAGVKFCFLVKGVRKQSTYNDDPNALYITYNPLIRGYKSFSPGGVAYAHSWFYPNGENKSGQSVLGKGWEPFNVWEAMGVEKWMEMIEGGMQSECGDVIKKHVVTPPEYFRNETEIQEALREVIAQEQEIMYALNYHEFALRNPEAPKTFHATFPHYQHNCNWMKGDPCEYRELCWNPTVSADPLASELYQIRVPHHVPERVSKK